MHYGDNSHNLNVNESAYHGMDILYASEDLDDTPLELIEAQIGSFLD